MNNDLPLHQLLPLRAVEVTLRFLAPAHPRPFHQPALSGFLRSLLGESQDYDALLWIDTPENGRCAYQARDRYRFALYALAGGEHLLQRLLSALEGLPGSTPRLDPALPFRDNLAWVEARGLFSGEPVRAVDQLTAYAADDLQRETELWAGQSRIALRWLSPARLLLPKQRRRAGHGRERGEARYCRGRADLDAELLGQRLHDTPAALLRRHGISTAPRHDPATVTIDDADLFWVDADYRDAQGRAKTMGGMLGRVDLSGFDRLPPAQQAQWVLGQYLGIGQRRAFGWGRYRLETSAGEHSTPRAEPAASMLERAAEVDNLRDAWHAIDANQRPRPGGARRDRDDAWAAWLDDADDAAVDTDDDRDGGEPFDDDPGDRLDRIAARLGAGRYQPARLRGRLHHNPDGGLRPLAVPPFFDRVTQRAVAQVIGPGLDALMSEASFGYRRGRSRHDAGRLIQRAWTQGYRWVYESDIDDFFDSVDWRHLDTRLTALFGDDPVVRLLLAWMAAPVDYQGETIPRDAGLPQGAPLSPLLANLMLDDFDSDLETAGFKLARFADDFVILCKDRERAEAAARVAEASLADIGLALNADKTRITPFAQGFRYLGYLFMDSLALDVSGERRRRPAGAPNPEPPPNSWLARLNQRAPRALAADGAPLEPRPVLPATPGPVATQPAPEPDPHRPLRIGDVDGDDASASAMLFITGAPAQLATGQGRLRVTRGGETLTSLPWKGISAVVLFGAHHATTPALRAALAQRVPIHFATGAGRYQGVLWHGRPGEQGIDLWLQQSACFQQPEAALAAARSVVEARLRHLRELLRQRATDQALDDAIGAIDQALGAVADAADRQVLNGIEGIAARAGFQAMRHLLPPEFGFDGRNRRPPRDPFNALLSLGYHVLYSHTETLLHADGLLPWRGFYHQAHGRHAALASDLMEPFRHLIERSALTAVSRGALGVDDFLADDGRGCRLKDAARRHWLALLTRRFDTPVQALGDDQARTVPQHLHRQNRRLIAWIRGEVGEFRAWRTR